MEFGDLINDFVHQTANFEEATHTLEQMAREAPNDFISNLIQVITQTSDKSLQLNATKMLTIPFKRVSSTFFITIDTSVITAELKNQLIQMLIEMLCFESNIAKAASDAIVFITSPNSLDCNSLVKHLISLCTPENAESVSVPLLEAISQIARQAFIAPNNATEYSFILFNFFANVETNDAQKRLFFCIVSDFIRYTFPNEGDDTEGFISMISFIWSFLPQFPKEVFNFFKPCLASYARLIIQLPEFSEQVFAAIQSDNNDVKLAVIELLSIKALVLEEGTIKSKNVISEGKEQELITILIDSISEDDDTSEIEPSSLIDCCSKLLVTLIQPQMETLSDTVASYAIEHAQSERNGERYVSMLFFLSLLSYFDKPDEAFMELIPQFITFSLHDQSERVVYLGFQMVEVILFKPGIFQIDEQIIGYVTELVCSNNHLISSSAFDLLFLFFTKGKDEETRLNTASFIFSYITEIEDDKMRADLLRNLSQLCCKMPPQIAVSIIPTAHQLVTDILAQMDSNDIPLSLSPAIGFYCSIFIASEDQASEYASEFFQFGTDLVSNNLLNDGITVFSALMKFYGTTDSSIPDFSTSIIREHLPSVSNQEEFSALLNLCQSTIKYIEDIELLSLILDSCISYANTIPDTYNDQQYAISCIITKIYFQSPDLIISRFHDVLEVIYIREKYFLSDDTIQMFIGCVSEFNEDPLCAKAISDSLYRFGFKLVKGTKVDGEQLIILLQTAQVVDPTGTTVLPSIRLIASNFHKIAPNYDTEISSKIQEYLPEIPPQLSSTPQPLHIYK